METQAKGQDLTITLNDFAMSYDDVGEGNIPVIFLHGYPFDKTSWRGQLDHFKDTYRLIALDIRGFGKSTDEETPLSMDLFSEDLIAFMDKMHINKAILCGLSMGGYIALTTQKKFPDRVHALVLCDTQCIADTIEKKKKRYQAIGEIEVDSVEDFNEKFIASVFHKNTLTNNKELVEQVRKVVFQNSPYIISQGLVALAERAETCSTLSQVQVPTMIICGREDGVTPLAESQFMHENIAGSELRVIDDAGHVSNLEQPHEFNKHLGEFLSKVAAGATDQPQ